jgi:hypothetical protein
MQGSYPVAWRDGFLGAEAHHVVWCHQRWREPLPDVMQGLKGRSVEAGAR